jgi:hypothetical protein
MIIYRRLFSYVAATVAVVFLVAASVGNASVAARAGDDSDGGDATCSGGSIASGVYKNLNIAGVCTVDAGSVTVKHDLTVLPGGSLVAVTGGFGAFPAPSNITVGGNLDVQEGGLLNLGCEPIHFICANDPDQVVGTY